MYQTVICLVLPLPAGSSNLPGQCLRSPGSRRAADLSCSVLLRMGFACAPVVTARAVVFYTAFAPLPAFAGGIFLLHWPGSRLHRTLSGILPCEARTFLTCSLSSLQPRPSVPLRRVPYHNSCFSASTWFFTGCSAVICDAQLHESSNRILSFLGRTASAELAPGF